MVKYLTISVWISKNIPIKEKLQTPKKLKSTKSDIDLKHPMQKMPFKNIHMQIRNLKRTLLLTFACECLLRIEKKK